MENKNKKLLDSFVEYCNENPDLRFGRRSVVGQTLVLFTCKTIMAHLKTPSILRIKTTNMSFLEQQKKKFDEELFMENGWFKELGNGDADWSAVKRFHVDGILAAIEEGKRQGYDIGCARGIKRAIAALPQEEKELKDSGITRVEATMYAFSRAWNACRANCVKNLEALLSNPSK